MSATAVRAGWCSHLGRPRGRRFLRCTHACAFGRVHGRLECVQHVPIIPAGHHTVAATSTDPSGTSHSPLVATVAVGPDPPDQAHQPQLTSTERKPPHRYVTRRHVPMKTAMCHLKRGAKPRRHKTIRFVPDSLQLLSRARCLAVWSNKPSSIRKPAKPLPSTPPHPRVKRHAPAFRYSSLIGLARAKQANHSPLIRQDHHQRGRLAMRAALPASGVKAETDSSSICDSCNSSDADYGDDESVCSSNTASHAGKVHSKVHSHSGCMAMANTACDKQNCAHHPDLVLPLASRRRPRPKPTPHLPVLQSSSDDSSDDDSDCVIKSDTHTDEESDLHHQCTCLLQPGDVLCPVDSLGPACTEGCVLHHIQAMPARQDEAMHPSTIPPCKAVPAATPPRAPSPVASATTQMLHSDFDKHDLPTLCSSSDDQIEDTSTDDNYSDDECPACSSSDENSSSSDENSSDDERPDCWPPLRSQVRSDHQGSRRGHTAAPPHIALPTSAPPPAAPSLPSGVHTPWLLRMPNGPLSLLLDANEDTE
jgi:hypothetical protein